MPDPGRDDKVQILVIARAGRVVLEHPLGSLTFDVDEARVVAGCFLTMAGEVERIDTLQAEKFRRAISG